MESVETQGESWLTVVEAAAHLKLSPTTIYRAVQRQEIPHYRIGRAVRFKAAELDAWAVRFRVAPREGTH